MKRETFNWKDIKLSKEVNPREVLDKRPYGKQTGETWKFRGGEAYAKSMFADGKSKRK